jgi:hypothetical protein
MPTNRTRRPRSPSPDAISSEAVRAWHIGDFHALNRELAVAPCDFSPFDVSAEGAPPAYIAQSPWRLMAWRRGQELRRQLLRHGPPGRVGRHGDPLGPARIRPRDDVP